MKIIGLIVFLSMSPLFAAGKVLFLKGEVTLNSKALKKGDSLSDGDRLKTGEQSVVLVKFEEGSTIKLNEKSEVKVNLSHAKEKKSLFSMIRGTSFFKLDPKAKGKLGVKTKRASMAVRGTEFFVAIMEKDDFMCVRKGAVSVQDKDRKKVLVKEGQGVSIGKAVSKPSFLPWTEGLNWKLDTKEGNLENKVNIQEQYKSPLEQDYD